MKPLLSTDWARHTERVRNLTRLEGKDIIRQHLRIASVELGIRWMSTHNWCWGRLAACFAPSTGLKLLVLACHANKDDVREIAADLRERSLLRVRDGQYALHALMRDFAHATMDEGETWDTARRAVVSGCMEYANQHNSESRADHDALDL